LEVLWALGTSEDLNRLTIHDTIPSIIYSVEWTGRREAEAQ
jgi:hypothetical protein